MSANILKFKRINQFIRLNVLHERSHIRKALPKVNIYVLIITALDTLDCVLYMKDLVRIISLFHRQLLYFHSTLMVERPECTSPGQVDTSHGSSVHVSKQ